MALPPHMTSPQFIVGVLLAVVAASMMLLSDASVAAPISVLIVAIVLIALSRRRSAD